MANVITDHNEIRSWIEAHGGQPALVRRIPEVGGDGELSFEFLADGQEPELITIRWDDFFQRFEDQGLAFVYEDASAGAPTWYLVDRNRDSGAHLV